MNEIVQKATLDLDTTNRLIKIAVNEALTHLRRNRSGRYDYSMFWELYRRIADAFVREYETFEIDSIPVLWRERPTEYLIGIWEGYFLNEIRDLISTNPRFPDLIDSTLANYRNYFRYTEKIDEILRNRYAITD